MNNHRKLEMGNMNLIKSRWRTQLFRKVNSSCSTCGSNVHCTMKNCNENDVFFPLQIMMLSPFHVDFRPHTLNTQVYDHNRLLVLTLYITVGDINVCTNLK